jgi:hypothetical protein
MQPLIKEHDLIKNINIKRLANWAGAILMVASLGFIARRIFLTHDDVDFSVFRDPAILAALISVALLEGVGIVMASLNYRAIVANISGIKVRYPLALVVYTVSNLYKYIPGGVMYVLGRNKMAIDTEGLSHAKVGLATILEGITIALAAIFVAVVFSYRHSMYYIRQLEPASWMIVVLLSVAGLLIVLYITFRKKLAELWHRLKADTKDLHILTMLKRLVFAIVLMILWAFTFLATLMLLGQEVNFRMGITVMGLYMLSWLVGFLTPGAPSGLGVREGVMLMFMTGTLNEGILISAMFMHRMLTVAGDVSAYGMALFFSRGRHR